MAWIVRSKVEVMSVAPSIVRQIQMALLPLFEERPEAKKHELPEAQRHLWIWSGKTLENYLQWCNRWAEWAKEEKLGLRQLVDANLMGQPYVQHLIDYQGPEPDDRYSPWTVSGTVSALRKLEVGIQRRWGRELTLIVPQSLVNREKRELGLRKRRGHYPADEIRLLRLYIEAEYRPALDACLALGLRRHEVIAMQAQDVDMAATTCAVKGLNGLWSPHPLPPGYAGVIRVRRGKGGRPREVAIPLRYRDTLANLVRAVGPETRLWPVQAKAFGYAIIRACRAARIGSRGVHGLRHSWALREYLHLRGLGYSDTDARQCVSWWLGHNRLQVTTNYIVRKVDLDGHAGLLAVD